MLGRLEVRDKIGSGGMGDVFAAWDPDLDREVAVKLLRMRGNPKRREVARARMMAEARAMAHVSHPNVLPIFDVARHGDDVYIAMELVDGGTLTRWQAEQDRTWSEIVGIYLAAGRGLAAAHARGVIHRDFKPGNVLLGRDGRIYVGDFGLAKPAADSSSSQGLEPDTGVDDAESLRSEALTEAGHVMGTPLFMAPEVHMGKEASPASDQYSFCVALFMALYGVRPFPGSRLQMVARKKKGLVEPTPTGSAVPARIHRMLLRGLDPDPAKRWPSMEALLARLVPRRRSPWIPAVAVLAVVAGAGVFASGEDEPETCATAPGIEADWNVESKEGARERFDAVGARRGAFDRVARRLDAWGAEWTQAHTGACEAMARADRSQLADSDGRMHCLDRARSRFAAFVGVLTRANEAVVARSVVASARLPDLSRCEQTGHPMLEPEDPALAREVEDLRRRLDQGEASLKIARLLDAEDELVAAVDDARRLGYGPVLAEALQLRGSSLTHRGEYIEAAQVLEEAYFVAVEAGHHRVAAKASLELASTIGVGHAKPAEGREWLRHARTHVGSAPDPVIAVAIPSAQGLLAEREGRSEEAVTFQREALATAVEAFGEESYFASQAHNNLGMSLFETGHYLDAEAHFRQALEVRKRVLGPDHPLTGTATSNLGVALKELKRFEEASEAHQRALAITEAQFGPTHADVAGIHLNLGVVAADLGRLGEAVTHYRTALQVFEATLGPDHPRVGTCLQNLGGTLVQLGRVDEALAVLGRATTIVLHALGPKHPSYGGALHNLALAEVAAGDLDGAVQTYGQAVETLVAARGEHHPTVASVRVSLAEAYLLRDAPELAVAELERALEIHDAVETRPGGREKVAAALDEARKKAADRR